MEGSQASGNKNLNQTTAAILGADEKTLLYTLHCNQFLGDAEMSFQQTVINLHHSTCHHHLLQKVHATKHFVTWYNYKGHQINFSAPEK